MMNYRISKSDFLSVKRRGIKKPIVLERVFLGDVYIHLCSNDEMDLINVWNIQGFYESSTVIVINDNETLEELSIRLENMNKKRKPYVHSTSFKMRKSKERAVIAHTVGGTYLGKWCSQTNCANALNIKQSNISASMKSGRPYKGMLFKSVE